MRFCTITLGCKANQFDTSTMEGILAEHGHVQVKLGDGCDVCVINTCAVTAESVRKSRQAVRRVKKLEPNALVAVCGCFSELEPETAASIGADLIGGADNRESFALEIGKALLIRNDSKISLPSANGNSTSSSPVAENPLQSNRTRALLKIQDGCDNYCAYCIIPFVRGRSRSTPLEKLTQQASQFEMQGFKELIITGIEISSWQGENTDLIDAVNAISKAAPNARLRIGSLDPTVLTDDFIRKLAQIPNLCNHFHISLQSGCDETLQRMGRKYTTNAVKQTINKLKESFSDCGITADLIVGFPGETDDEFNRTMDFIRIAEFSDMHIFPFSPRPGTKAAVMSNQINRTTIKERARSMTKLATEKALDFKKQQLGKTVEVLFEQEKNACMTGYSENYLHIAVEIESQQSQNSRNTTIPQTNSIHHVEIKKLENDLVVAELLIDKSSKD